MIQFNITFIPKSVIEQLSGNVDSIFFHQQYKESMYLTVLPKDISLILT